MVYPDPGSDEVRAQFSPRVPTAAISAGAIPFGVVSGRPFAPSASVSDHSIPPGPTHLGRRARTRTTRPDASGPADHIVRWPRPTLTIHCNLPSSVAGGRLYIRSAHIERFRHLSKIDIGPFAEPAAASQVIALAGPNGSGKSSVLELMSYTLSNMWSLSWGLPRTFADFSFEVEIGLTSEELPIIAEKIRSLGGDRQILLDTLDRHRGYVRSFNYPGGRYADAPNAHNQLHDIATATLRNEYGRALGFFIKSDRLYPNLGFDRNKIFDFKRMQSPDHKWGLWFNTSEVQYRDMFEYLVQQKYHYVNDLGKHLWAQLNDRPSAQPEDPIAPYDALLRRLFPGYSFTSREDEDVPSNLFVRLADSTVVPFSDLSSGEKEVFFLLAFFLRHAVTKAVVAVDEPELHLHPELSRLLLRELAAIRPENQIWVATHNPEVIEEAGRENVIYFSREDTTKTATVVRGTDEPAVSRNLKLLYGQAGYVGVGSSMVFVEGTGASVDRRFFSALFPSRARVKIVPSQGVDNLVRINAAVLDILEGQLGAMTFYLIRDRDYLTAAQAEQYRSKSAGRIHVLDRNQVENYLLVDELIANVEREVFGQETSADEVGQLLSRLARALAGETLRDALSFQLNLLTGQQDFGQGNFLRGDSVVDNDGAWDPAKISMLDERFLQRARQVRASTAAALEDAAVVELRRNLQNELQRALIDGTWRRRFPGKRLLEAYESARKLGKTPAFQNALVRALATAPAFQPAELTELIGAISGGRPLS